MELNFDYLTKSNKLQCLLNRIEERNRLKKYINWHELDEVRSICAGVCCARSNIQKRGCALTPREPIKFRYPQTEWSTCEYIARSLVMVYTFVFRDARVRIQRSREVAGWTRHRNPSLYTRIRIQIEMIPKERHKNAKLLNKRTLRFTLGLLNLAHFS